MNPIDMRIDLAQDGSAVIQYSADTLKRHHQIMVDHDKLVAEMLTIRIICKEELEERERDIAAPHSDITELTIARLRHEWVTSFIKRLQSDSP